MHPPPLPQVLADGLYGAPRNASQAAAAFWRFMALTGGWREGGKHAAERFAGGHAWVSRPSSRQPSRNQCLVQS